MKTNRPHVQVAFSPGNTRRHQQWQGGIPAIAWLCVNIQLASLILYSFRPGKMLPQTLPCGVSREILTRRGSWKAALLCVFSMGYLAFALSKNSPGHSLLLPPSPKHPARKGSPGRHENQCDFCFGQMQSVQVEQVEQANNTGYLDHTKGFVVCHVDWAVRRFRYTWQFSHICLIFFFKSLSRWAGTDLNVLRLFFVSEWKLCRQLQIS